MGILYNVPDLKTWGFMAFVLLALIAFNELGRTKKWGGILLFVIVPLVLTIAIWPTTAGLTGLRLTLHWQVVSALC